MRIVSKLNGIWDFGWFGDVEPSFPLDCKEVMPVPGCFDLVEPYCGKRGHAAYKRMVRAGGNVRLHVDGIGIRGVWHWDGKTIGECKSAYMPEEFFFDAGAEGEHELALLLDNYHSDYFRSNFDFYGYGGIYGDVTLERVPPNPIRRVLVSTEDYKTGLVRVRADIAEYKGAVEVSFDGRPCATFDVSDGALDVLLNVPDHRLWSCDEPNLHRIALKTADDEWECDFGIREVRAEGRRILLNGKPIRLLGYNRHESHPEVGAATSPQLMAADLRMLKEQGGNFIRGSHYPQRKPFLELCDKMGVLVWEETLGWGITPPLLHSEEYLEFQKEEVRKLTLSSFNHPCVIIRAFLNEPASELKETRKVIKTLYDEIRSIDEHCLISFATYKYEKDVCTDLVDVVSMNPYPGWYDSTYDNISTIGRVKPVLQKLSDDMPKDRPLLITEIGSEAIYGFRDPLKTRWSEEYQAEQLTEAVKVILDGDDFAGISIWQFADTRSFVNGPEIYGRARGFNNKGVLDEYRRPKLAWYLLKTLFKP